MTMIRDEQQSLDTNGRIVKLKLWERVSSIGDVASDCNGWGGYEAKATISVLRILT